MRKSLCLIPLSVLALTACGGSNNSGPPFGGTGSGSSGSSSSSSSGGVSSTEEFSTFVLALIANDTSATAAPIDLSTVSLIDTPSVEATAYDGLFASSSSSGG